MTDASPANVPVNTKHAERRTLHFDSLEDIEADLDALRAASDAGTLRNTGNYTPGQVLHHLARWMTRYAERDLPKNMPLHMKLIGRVMKGRVLKKGFPAGLPGPEGKAQPEPDVSFAEGEAYLRRMHDVMRTSDFGHQNPFLGTLTHADCVQIHLRHCELHLGFLHPQ